MTHTHTTPVPNTIFLAKYPWWRIPVLCLLLLLSVVVYILLIGAAPKNDSDTLPFLHVWMLSFLPYFAACTFVLATKAPEGRWRWIELGIILVGAIILRAMLLPLPPGLSHDAWRYLWDARVILHGYSPYIYAPWDKVLQPLQDALIYGNSRFRNVPTIYPPGAEALYVLSYLLAPSNLFVLKGIFVVFDMVTCGAVAMLLARNGLDLRRVIIYAWCPLPIVEFAIQGRIGISKPTIPCIIFCRYSSGNWKDQDVVMLESMKMQIPVQSTVDGVVKAIKVNEGDFVDDGDVLLEVE